MTTDQQRAEALALIIEGYDDREVCSHLLAEIGSLADDLQRGFQIDYTRPLPHLVDSLRALQEARRSMADDSPYLVVRDTPVQPKIDPREPRSVTELCHECGCDVRGEGHAEDCRLRASDE